MDTKLLEKQFARMGARLKVNVRSTIRRSPFTGFAVDIGKDGRGPFFDVTLGEDAERELDRKVITTMCSPVKLFKKSLLVRYLVASISITGVTAVSVAKCLPFKSRKTSEAGSRS